MNLVEEGHPGGKTEAEAPRAKEAVKEGEEKRVPERGRSKEKDKKKKKQKKGRSSGEDKSPKEEEKNKRSAPLARKSLKSVFAGTGMDPDPKVRNKIAAKASKRLKKKKKSSSGSSSTGSSSDSSEEESGELFEETQKVRRIGRLAPGALTTAGCREMASNLLNSTQGIWDQKGRFNRFAASTSVRS